MRPVTETDFDSIYAIYMDEQVNPYLRHEIMDKKSFQSVFEELVSRDAFWAYEHDGAVIGMCACTYGYARTAHVAELGTLGFLSSAHGTGHAKMFLEDILESLITKGFKRIDLWVEADNERAQKFYKKLGFQVDGIIPNYFKRANSEAYIDELVMSKLF